MIQNFFSMETLDLFMKEWFPYVIALSIAVFLICAIAEWTTRDIKKWQ